MVDDREDNLFSIEAILEKDGYIIRKANSGRAALRVVLKEDDFTLILMDVQMPDLNGFETATLIYERDKLKHIPIIFITANDYGEDSVFKGYQMGGVDYIYKHVNPELLRAKVAVFVELYKKNHQLLAQEQKMAAANKRLEKEDQRTYKFRSQSEPAEQAAAGKYQPAQSYQRRTGKVCVCSLSRPAGTASQDHPLQRPILY